MAQKYLFTTDYSDSNKPIESSLQHFSAEQIDTILDWYRDQKSILDIREEFPEISYRAFEKQLPYILSDENCEKCGEAVYYLYKRESNKKELLIDKKLCGSCKHDYTYHCECYICASKRSIEKEMKDRIFSYEWNTILKEDYATKVDLKDLSEEDQIKLYRITKHYLTIWNFIYFNAHESHLQFSDDVLNSKWSEIHGIIDHLMENKIIIPSIHNTSHIMTLVGDLAYFPKMDDFGFMEYYWDINVYNNNILMKPLEYIDYVESKPDSMHT